jgi:hypothetical protein
MNNEKLTIWLNFVENLVILGFMFCIINFKEVSDWWIILATFIFTINYNKVYNSKQIIIKKEKTK